MSWFDLLFEEGRRERWPHTYRAKDAKAQALAHGAIPDHSNLGHNLLYEYCQFCTFTSVPGAQPCYKCYPHMRPA